MTSEPIAGSPPTPRPMASGPKKRSAWRVTYDVVTTVIAVIAVMLAAVAIVVAVATHLSPKGEYVVFGHPVMSVASGSMSPTIKTGDLVVDKRVNAVQAQHLKVGQIISVRESPSSPTIITHRIVAVTTVNGVVSYVTKGDRNNTADASPRPASDVIGVFSSAIPRGGYILSALHRPLVLGLLLASPILWFIAGPLFELARSLDQEPAGEPEPIDDKGAGAP